MAALLTISVEKITTQYQNIIRARVQTSTELTRIRTHEVVAFVAPSSTSRNERKASSSGAGVDRRTYGSIS